MPTGVPGLDDILDGGLPVNRVHLVQGFPGTGKTTLALQFLIAGAARGERALYITLAETEEELIETAVSHGWDLSGVTIRELTPSEDDLTGDQQYTILHASDVALSETTQELLRAVEEVKPTLVVIDSLTEIRLVAQDRLRYRNQVLALKQFFAGRNSTVLMLDSTDPSEGSIESIAHSVLQLEQAAPDYGTVRRRLRVLKVRGSGFRGGYHDLILDQEGMILFPSLVAAEHREPFDSGLVSSGLPELDALLGGGLPRGTSTLLAGPAGAGKTLLTTQYAVAAAERGERVAMFIFDETIATFLDRSRGLGLPVEQAIEDGLIMLEQLDPAQLSPGEFVHNLRTAVEEHDARMVVIDSLNGYLNAMAVEQLVIVQLHEILTYLGQQGVVTLMTVAQHGMFERTTPTPLDASYLADTVMLLRYFEVAGELRQALSVVKKRSGPHEHTIREFRVGPGLRIGEPLREFQGVLGWAPAFTGSTASIMGAHETQVPDDR